MNKNDRMIALVSAVLVYGLFLSWGYFKVVDLEGEDSTRLGNVVSTTSGLGAESQIFIGKYISPESQMMGETFSHRSHAFLLSTRLTPWSFDTTLYCFDGQTLVLKRSADAMISTTGHLAFDLSEIELGKRIKCSVGSSEALGTSEWISMDTLASHALMASRTLCANSDADGSYMFTFKITDKDTVIGECS